MKITVKRYDEERTVLVGLIVDRNVLARVASHWEGEPFRSEWANRVGQWCVDYFRRFRKAPGPHVQNIFESWAAENRNKQLVQPMETFLSSLSHEYQRLRKTSNSDFVLDLAGVYFNRVRLEKLAERIQGDLDTDQSAKALERVQQYRKLELGTGSMVDVFQDADAIRSAFENISEPLVIYPGGLGEFFGDRLERDGFIAFTGPEKRGKTWWLLDVAFRASLQDRRVAFFEVGDMSEAQIMRRFMVRVAHHPMRAKTVDYPTNLIKPKKRGHIPIIEFKKRVFAKPLNWKISFRACQEMLRRHKEKSLLRLSTHHNSTISVDGIRCVLDSWQQQDSWIPDLIVIDYADILNMEVRGLEGRDRIDHTWRQLRRLSQENHCLVVTATQSDAASYEAHTLGQRHFSDDKRKHAHVTGMIGLNQTKIEKANKLMRLNWIDLREADNPTNRCCYVASCLDLANVAVRSLY